MRRKCVRCWSLSIVPCAVLFVGGAPAQTTPALPAIDHRAPASVDERRNDSRASAADVMAPLPPAPQPIPGPASRGRPGAGKATSLPVPLPINLATAMQLAGVRPLDIATAAAQVEQALALQLQARVLWIPNLNAGVD